MPGPGMNTAQALLAVAVIGAFLVLNVVVLRKAGRSPWWTLLFLVPPAYLVGIWLFAFSRWPGVDAVHVTPPSDYEGGWDVPPHSDNDKKRGNGDRPGKNR